MDAGLTALLWATYHGGSGDDSGYGVQFDGSGNILVTGAPPASTCPFRFPVGRFASRWSGRLRAPLLSHGQCLDRVHLVGTTAYDQCYLVQLNTADEVFIVGQSEGPYPVTPGKYVNLGSSAVHPQVHERPSTSFVEHRDRHGQWHRGHFPIRLSGQRLRSIT